MTERDILRLIESDKWMMSIIQIAAAFDLPDWLIGAGFVRNKVWDYLHGYVKEKVDTNNIDLVYFDPHGNDEKADEALSKELKERTGMEWEVVNEVYAHKWNNLLPYTSSEDCISQWSETATAVGVTLKDGTLKLVAPYGINNLVNMVIRPSPRSNGGMERIMERVEKKSWLLKWPKLKIEPEQKE